MASYKTFVNGNDNDDNNDDDDNTDGDINTLP